MRVSDIKLHDSLTIVTLEGFKGEERYPGDPDPIGSANYFAEGFGQCYGDPESYDEQGSIWSDYDGDGDPWSFSLLIDTEHLDALLKFAEDENYSITKTEEITEPVRFGDGNGTAEVVKFPDGWAVVTS